MKESNDELGHSEPNGRDESHKSAGTTVYVPLLEDQLGEERSRKSSFEQRGVAVITTSGVLVSLLFGLAATVTKSQGFSLPNASRAFLLVALVFFVLAAIGGIISNWPLRYSQIHVEDFRRFVDPKNWNGPPDIASRRVAEAHVSVLERARKLNLIKGQALLVAMIIEVLAVVALAAAVALLLVQTGV